ncbi:hypothetical protein [Curtobacterium sp. UNCCL17]|uniref:hypothetical protein n=1 Tax=Curtobacterium sp. UNCCL17 TaxID=1449051 RepID=UPI0012DBE3F3|nr:hypothetical protein [Curtobacterium sp. UNCCL17]
MGDEKPYKVRIELVADEWQGYRRWVAPSRLEVLWDDRHDYIALDEKIRAVKAWQPARLDRRTAEHVFFKLIPLDVAVFNADSAGTSVIYGVAALARLSGLSQDELRASPAFLHDQELTVPWPTTERIGRAVAALRPHLLLSEIEREERETNEHALNGVQAVLVAERALDALESTQKRISQQLRGELAGLTDVLDMLPPSPRGS